MAVRSLSPSSFAFNDSNYDNENANAGSRSHLCLKKSVERRPRLLAKNDNSKNLLKKVVRDEAVFRVGGKR